MYSNIFKLLLLFLAPTIICEVEPEKKKILLERLRLILIQEQTDIQNYF